MAMQKNQRGVPNDNASKPRPRVKPERRVTISPFISGGYAMSMTIGTGEKVKHYGYYVDPKIPH
jgi:hypothetical protein